MHQLSRDEVSVLPRLITGRREVFGHAIGHGAGAIKQVLPQRIELLVVIGPIHKLLALFLAQGQPVVQLQLQADEI